MTASLLKSPGLFSVLWPTPIMLYFGWSPLVHLFSSLLVPVLILWWSNWARQLQLVSPSHSYSIVFFSSFARSKYFLTFRFPSVLPCCRLEQAISLFGWFIFVYVLTKSLGDPFVSQNSRELYASHSPGRIPGCVYIICSNLNLIMVKFKFFTIYSQWITFLTQTCLVLYSFCANLLNLLIRWYIWSCGVIFICC